MLIKSISYTDVSQRLFQYSLWDTHALRNKYFKATSITATVSVSKQHMIEALVREDLGNDIVDKYLIDAKRQVELERAAAEQWMDEKE